MNRQHHSLGHLLPSARRAVAVFCLLGASWACLPSPVSIGLDEAQDGSVAADAGGGSDASLEDSGLGRPDANLVGGPDLHPVLPGALCPVSPQYAVPTFEVSVENQGDQAAGPFAFRLVACAGACSAPDPVVTLYERAFPNGLAAGAQQPLAEPMPALPASPVGAWQLSFVVDPEDAVPELDEQNNASAPYAFHNGLQVLPAALDFGAVCVGRTSQLGVSLSNLGAGPVTIDAIYDLTSSAEISFQTPAVPTTLAAGQSTTLLGSYAPVDGGRDWHQLWIRSDLSVCPVVLVSAGEGLAGTLQVEHLTQRPAPRMDVLAVIDGSGSMADNQSELQANLPLLLSDLQGAGVDFHLGVTTTDLDVGGPQGRLLGTPTVLDNGTANLATTWAARFNVGTSGSGLDQGIDASLRGLSPPLVGTDNLGFLRDDASLLVLYVSDEDDGAGTLLSVAIDILTGLKADPQDLRINAVIPIPGSNCGPGGAPRYQSLVDATAGRSTDVCASDWSWALSDLARDGFGLQRRFVLGASSQVTQADLSVTVNQSSIAPNLYQYDPATRVLSFNPSAVPPAGASITVSYSNACP